MREQMLQGICYFYFLVSQPLDDLEGMGHFSNSLQYYEPFASWLRDFAVVQGQYMDTEDSWNQETYDEIFADTDFGLQEDWYEDSPTGTPSTDSFANGVLTHAFLNVNDYHRYHFAVGGKILEKEILTRDVALEVSWDETQGIYIPLDSTGWQFSQTLGYVIVDTDEYGLVALIPMGMAMVSSVNFEDNASVGNTLEKGEMLGNFLFGGSDFIMLFQEDANFQITAPMQSYTTYNHILVGEEFGILNSVE